MKIKKVIKFYCTDMAPQLRLNTVKTGKKVLHNIQASVVHNNNAPILFGQSDFTKFGKTSIDYNTNKIASE